MNCTISHYRLRETTEYCCYINLSGVHFEILKSKCGIVTQYYIVRSEWVVLPRRSRIIPLAHINKTLNGNFIIKIWNPVLFNIAESDLDVIKDVIKRMTN
jgi:hypothetical protein